ncbi:MAG: hypothetical protein ACSLFJ_13060 [Immundisolibacter sp.]|uniref:hypothetical protein n=1 Tax=Immundisolibacter sp. TaxID=1934948 RepID=UPI003EE348E1
MPRKPMRSIFPSSRRRGVSLASYIANRMLDEPPLIVRMQGNGELIPIEAASEPIRSSPLFTPERECECSRKQASEDAGPKRNEEAIYHDFPSKKDAQQLQQRDERENEDSQRG